METELLCDCDLFGSLRLAVIDHFACVLSCDECRSVFDNLRPTIDELVRSYSTPGKYDDWLTDENLRCALWLPRLRLTRKACEIHFSRFRPEVLREALQARGFIVERQTLDPYFVASGLRRIKAEGRLVYHRVTSRLHSEPTYDATWIVAVRQ